MTAPEDARPLVASSGAPESDAAVAAASRAIRDMCGWHIFPVLERTVTVTTPGGHVTALPSLRVEEVLDVVLHPLWGEPRTLAPDAYRLAGTLLHTRECLPAGPVLIVTMRDGYASVDALAQIARRWALREIGDRTHEVMSDRIGPSTVGYGGGAGGGFTRLANVDARDRAIIDQYRLPALA